MHAAAISLLFLTGLCGEPRHDDCGDCYRPHLTVFQSWRHWYCGISLQGNPHVNDWPLEYPPHPGEGMVYDYRHEMNYPWSNKPCCAPMNSIPVPPGAMMPGTLVPEEEIHPLPGPVGRAGPTPHLAESPKLAAPNELPSVMTRTKVTPILRHPERVDADAAPQEAARPRDDASR